MGRLGWAGWVLALVFLLTTIGFSVAWVRRPAVYSRVTPFTSFPGQKAYPVFSPDGNQIAFFWEGDAGNGPGIYVKLVDAGSLLQLVSLDAAVGVELAWSPDGRTIAFVRPGSGGGIFSVPVLGGAERKLTELTGEFAWSPDGRELAIAHRESPEAPSALVVLALETGQTRRLTAPPAESYGDASPAWSPDGRTIAYIHSPNFQVSDLYAIPAAGGESVRLTFDKLDLRGSLAWTADGREIVYSSNRGGLATLWRVPLSGGGPRRLIGAGEYAFEPAIARQRDRLAYVHRRIDRNIWRSPGPNASGAEGAPGRWIASTRDEVAPQYSPDGKRIVFISDRSGSREVWIASSDGRNAVQLTDFGGSHTGTPRWSPDGRRIAFDSRPDGQTDIFTIDVEGGRPRRVTREESEDVRPSWSADGRWIYFGSRRSGDWQVWKAPADGGPAVQVTTRGGYEALESADGGFLYYTKRDPGIWKMPVQGGEESLIFAAPRWGHWALAKQGIVFFDPAAAPAPVIGFFAFATRQVRLLARLEKSRVQPGMPGLAVSPDGQWILTTQVDQTDTDIMLVENFR